MPRFGWRFEPSLSAYFSEKEVSRENVEKNVASLLAKATKGSPWKDPLGVTHFSILKDDEIVGNLWEDVDLKNLQVGSYWAGSFGIKVELVHNGRVIGMLWLEA